MKSILIVSVIYLLVALSILAAVTNIVIFIRNISKYIKSKKINRRRKRNIYTN